MTGASCPCLFMPFCDILTPKRAGGRIVSFILKSDTFTLKLKLQVFESDIQYSTNTVMDAEVKSDDFCGKACMDIDIKSFAEFVADINRIYDKLSGTAEIAEPYGSHMYIAFCGDGRGHVSVSGLLHNKANTLEFENEVDQTHLKEFCHELKTVYEKYLPQH